MAEDVIIRGFGDDRSFPDFATEATIKAVAAALQKANAYNNDSTKYLAQIALGEKRGQVAMTKLLATMKNVAETTEETKKHNKNSDDKNDALAKKQNSVLGNLLTLGKDTMNMHKKQFTEQIKNDSYRNKLLKDMDGSDSGMSGTSASLIAGLKGMTGVASKVAGAVTAVAAAVKGANNYLLQQGTDRFNFAQELRQSGLATGLSESGASLTAFADKVRVNNFTLGEAAEFTQRFSQAVGVLGVDSSMAFVNSLALAGEEGGDMMRKFGMEFGEVANIAGTYLESVRNLGLLDRMNNQQLRNNMDDFMSTVISTSNVMKINMEDAAKMIAETLSRDDISSLLATMDPKDAAQVQEVVGMAGGAIKGGLGEALAMRLAAGSDGEFLMTPQYAAMLSDPITAAILPIVEQLAFATETGGVSGFQSALANAEPELQGFLDYASANREILLSGESSAQELVASIQRMRATVETADDGRQSLGADDVAVVGALEASRQFTLAMEGVNNELIKSGNFAENVNKITTANLRLVEALETEATAVAGAVSETLFNVTTGLQSGLTNLVAGITEGAGDFARHVGLMGSEADKTAAAVRAMRVSINETFGGGSVINAQGEISDNTINSLVAQQSELEQAIANDDGGNRNNKLFQQGQLSAIREQILNRIEEIEEKAPVAAAQLRIETGVNNLVQAGETVRYDPEQLALEGKVLLAGPGHFMADRDRDTGDHVLQGGGRMESREAAMERLASQFAGFENTFSALGDSNSFDLLESLGFHNDKTNFTGDVEQNRVNEMVQSLHSNNLLSREDLQTILAEMKNTTGSEGLFNFGAASISDSDAQTRLISAIETLVTQLRE